MFGNWNATVCGITLRAWTLTLLSMELVLIFLFLPASWLQQVYCHERGLAAGRLGEETAAGIERKSAAWFQQVLVDNGVLQHSYFLCEGERDEKDRFDDRGLGAIFARRLDVFWLAVRHMFYRFGMIELWGVCALFLLPLTVDASLQRCIRQNRFAYSSPMVHHGAGIIVSMVFMGLVLSPMLPLTMSPMSTPAGLALCGAALWFYLSNYQKRN